MTLKGGCLCGQARYLCDGEPMVTGHCYCRDCRRASGTAHCTHVMISDAGFHSEGEVRFYARPADSGHIVRRGFCPICGSHLYSTNDASPGMVFLRASSLDDPDAVTPQMSVYASRAPAWDAPPSHLPMFAEMPLSGPSPVDDTHAV